MALLSSIRFGGGGRNEGPLTGVESCILDDPDGECELSVETLAGTVAILMERKS